MYAGVGERLLHNAENRGLLRWPTPLAEAVEIELHTQATPLLGIVRQLSDGAREPMLVERGRAQPSRELAKSACRLIDLQSQLIKWCRKRWVGGRNDAR
jgi:hypothetical protein